MLAPRKTLWSTPQAVLEQAVAWCGPLQPKDCVCDIGCGDGRCLVQWATMYSVTLRDKQSSSPSSSEDKDSSTSACFIGIDIDANRIQQAKQAWQQAVEKGVIDARIKAEFHCQNALEAYDIFCRATIIFLYLIPRGLRQIKPLLLQIPNAIQVVTYMSPLPAETPIYKQCIKIPHQPNAEWPIYAYRLNANDDKTAGGEG